jgi:hypothetical protein
VDIDSFIAWVRSFVFQFLGKRQLELLCRTDPNPGPITISILAVDREEYRLPPWDKFKEVINKAIEASSLPIDGDKVLETLKVKLKSLRKLKNNAAESTLNKFRTLLGDKPAYYTMGTHCEATLATLAQYHANLETEDQALIKTCQVHWSIIYIHSRE